jgi:uncharacterized membrane protein
MIFGYAPTVTLLTILGILALAGLVFQILLGKRVIRLKGRAHMKVHRWIAYAITAIAALHGFLALVRANFWVIGG